MHPDLVILDHSMPILMGLATTGEIHRLIPKVPILMLSMRSGKALIHALGAATTECADKLLEADAVMRGEAFFNAESSPLTPVSHSRLTCTCEGE